jgi:LCP family protein required for cell wall assembly
MRSRRTSRRHQSNDKGGIEETRVFQASEVRRPRRNWVKLVGLVVFMAVLFLGGVAYGFYHYWKNPSLEGLIPESELDIWPGRINILALGIDSGINGKPVNPQATMTGTRSDTMILVSFDPETKDVGLLFIPRDTRVFIPDGHGYEKAAHAHAYGGPDLAIRTVEQFLDVPIHHYVRVDFEGFKRVVDALDGVEFDIPQDMYYSDPSQNLLIDLKKGPTVLDGDKALQLVRYRQYENGDIGRVAVQKKFLEALFARAKSLSTVLKIPQLYTALAPYVKTDLTYDDIVNLASLASDVSLESLKIATVPGIDKYIDDGHGELSYWVADSEQTAKLVDELIRGISRERNASISVAVQEGNGVAGSADALAASLRAEGFNVVSVGKANRQDYQETRIVAPSGKRSSQYLVLTGISASCPGAKSFTGSVPEGADVLIIVGKDFTQSF